MRILQSVKRDPLLLMSALWPLALLAPLVPGLPTQSLKGLPWRQEIVLALLLCLTLALLARRAHQTGAWLANLLQTETRTLLPLTLFFFWSAASILWAASTFPALHHTFVWGAYLLFFFLLGRAARSPRRLRASMTTLAIVVCIISISSIVEFWGSTHLLIRSSTGLGEPLAVALPIFIVLALKLRRTRAAVVCGATAVLAWLAVLQSLERAPAIGILAALAVLFLVSLVWRKWRPRSLSRVLVLLLLFGAATALQTLPSPLTENRPSFVTRLQTATGANDPNTSVRLLTWAVGFEMWRERPLVGVGANNYDTAFAEARARFSVNHADSGLVALMEERLVERAHNEYIQILAELGAIGFVLFLVFCVALVLAAGRVLRRAQSPLALGCVCSLVVFALSSGASSVSFRWLGSGLIFFFAAALVSHFSAERTRIVIKHLSLAPAFARALLVLALGFSLVMLMGRGAQATNAVFQGMAESAATDEQVKQHFERAIAWNPLDATTHFNYGMWLYLDGRAPQAVPHLRYAVARGYNASVCYAYLAAAQAGAGEMRAAEQTLAEAVRVYPRSVFLRVRHATALAEAGRTLEANEEYAAALALDSRTARGWRQLICFGRKAAKTAAFHDKGIAMPGELLPENCIFAVLDENDKRQSTAILEEGTPLSGSAAVGRVKIASPGSL
jgi:O-antigen ligase